MDVKDGVLHAFREELGELYYYHGSSKNWTMMNYHYHETCEIILSMSDGVTIYIGKHSYTANRGDLFLIRSEEFHRVKPIANSNYARYVLMFDLARVRRLVEPLGYNFLRYFEEPSDTFVPKLSLPPTALTTMTELMNRLDPLYSTCKEPHSLALIYLLIAQMLIHVQDLYDFFYQDHPPALERNDVSFEIHDNSKDRIQQIKQFICDHIEEKLSLNLIAEQFFISKYYLSHYFRKETGFSIMQYIAMQKVIRAKHMLKQGYSITSIAMTLGYNSDSHFISTFQKYVGTTPKRYVLRLKDDQDA